MQAPNASSSMLCLDAADAPMQPPHRFSTVICFFDLLLIIWSLSVCVRVRPAYALQARAPAPHCRRWIAVQHRMIPHLSIVCRNDVLKELPGQIRAPPSFVSFAYSASSLRNRARAHANQPRLRKALARAKAIHADGMHLHYRRTLDSIAQSLCHRLEMQHEQCVTPRPGLAIGYKFPICYCYHMRPPPP
jgi:hypothetical protein